jgi:hypothetical protein
LLTEDSRPRPLCIAPGLPGLLTHGAVDIKPKKRCQALIRNPAVKKYHRPNGFVDVPEKALPTLSHRYRQTGFWTPGQLRPAAPIESGLYGSADSSRFYPQNQPIFELYGNFVQQLL